MGQYYANSFPLKIPTADETFDALQEYLNTLGLVPGFGEPFDAVNAMISFYRGDYLGAGLSSAAMIPLLG